MLIVLFAISLTAIAALFIAGYFYGVQKITAKMVVEGKRRENRANQALELWQTKVIEKAGMGSLRPKERTDAPQPQPSRRFVSASQAVSEMIADDAKGIPKYRIEKVPPAIGSQFLTNVGTIPAVNNKE